MSDASRPTSRWSTATTVTVNAANKSHQVTPLVLLRRKLLQQSASTKNNSSERASKSKQNVEDLFKLYYSNNVKYDNFKRQIVTGTRMPKKPTSLLSQDHLTASSTNLFNAKHFVSREQWSTTNLESNEQQQQQQQQQEQPAKDELVTKAKSSSTRRSVQIRTDNNIIINPPPYPPNPSVSPRTITPTLPKLPDLSMLSQREELCDNSLIKSVAFLGEIANDLRNTTTKKSPKLNVSQRPSSSKSSRSSKSTLSTVQAPPLPFSIQNSTTRKDPLVVPDKSFSMLTSSERQYSKPSALVTGTAVLVRQRPSTKLPAKQRKQSSVTFTSGSILSQSTVKTAGSPSTGSPSSIDPDISELPVFVGGQRIVSIPSKCSRYVLVTYPEVHLPYNTPSYVERLLLPERFPVLFQNIVQSYDPHLASVPHSQNPK